jgi:hypothetical protein
MAEPYHGGLSKDLAFTSSSQHSTDYFHNIIHSFQGDNRHLISTQQIYNSSAIDTVGHNSEVILDWPSLLRWRESEARDFAASACDEDKQLIRLYLPPLRRKYAQNSQSDSSPDCHWTPPVVDSSKQAAHIIVSHLFGHFREVSFTEVVEGAYGNSSKSTERLYACARHINHWYQSSTELQSKYKHILYVSPVRASTNMSADQISRNWYLNIRLLTTSSRVVLNLHPIIKDSA